MSDLKAVSELESQLQSKGVPCFRNGSEDYTALQKSFSGPYLETSPSVITRPRNGDDVAYIVSECIKQKLPMVVRGRGHDMFGRFTASDAVSIDLRDLTSVKVAEDGQSVSVGGGITSYQVLEALKPHKLQVPTGNCHTVGFVSWSLVGGFGSFIHSYGLGADQILGAKVVTADGKLVEADERLLKGLRGGGGSLGIVVELTVKTYPMEEVQAGVIVYESSDLSASLRTFFSNYNKMVDEHKQPKQFHLMPSVLVLPGIGKTLATMFIWNGSASDDSRAWVERVGNLATVMPGTPAAKDAVQTTTAVDFLGFLGTQYPESIIGRSQCATVSHLSPDVIEGIVKVTEDLPIDGVGGINMHLVRGDNPSCSSDVPDSVVPYREQHFMIELLGGGKDEASGENAKRWSKAGRDELYTRDAAVKQTYLALTSPEYVDLEAIYGDKLAELKAIKKEYDPNGVFINTVPRLI